MAFLEHICDEFALLLKVENYEKHVRVGRNKILNYVLHKFTPLKRKNSEDDTVISYTLYKRSQRQLGGEWYSVAILTESYNTER